MKFVLEGSKAYAQRPTDTILRVNALDCRTAVRSIVTDEAPVPCSNGQPASDGQPIADRLVAFFDANDEVVSITLENAIEVLAPYLSPYIAEHEALASASVLRDDGEPS